MRHAKLHPVASSVKVFSAINVFAGVSKHLKENGFTSEGNACLDAWLKADIHPPSGIKELPVIEEWGKGLVLP